MINSISLTNIFIPKISKKTGVFRNLTGLKHDVVSLGRDNLLSKPSEYISAKVKAAIENTSNSLGSGSEGKVYRIPETDYCVKLFVDSPKDFGKWKLDLTPEDRVNHVVAKAQNDAVIMKHIKGEPLSYGKEPDAIYNLPDKAYKDMLVQIDKAHKVSMTFDGAPANVIFNPENKSLTAIDFFKNNVNDENEYRPLVDMYASLSSKGYENSDMKKNRKLGGKILNIVLDELSSGKKPDFTIKREDMCDLLNKIRSKQNFKTPPQFEFLTKSINDIFRLKNKEYFGEDVTKELRG